MSHEWQIVHIKREVNFTTYGLVKMAVKQVIYHVWIKEISICISDIIFLEQTAIIL